jgi:phosphoenolpyruvate carboxylase
MEMVLAKTDLAVASRYAGLVADKKLRNLIFKRISTELSLTNDCLSQVTGTRERLTNNPTLARSIKNRFAYLDPLNHLQVELIKRHRSWKEDGKKADIWAMGNVLFNLLMGKLPFDISKHQKKNKDKNEQGKIIIEKLTPIEL